MNQTDVVLYGESGQLGLGLAAQRSADIMPYHSRYHPQRSCL